MSDIKSEPLPSTYRALMCSGVGEPLTIQTLPIPDAVPGSVIVRILASSVHTGIEQMLAGKVAGLSIPTPFVPGTRAIGRVAIAGPDTTSLEVGQLVLLEPFIRGRDDPNVQFLWGFGVFGTNPKALKLMEGTWRDGLFAEYARAPLENCFALDERLLLGSPAAGGLGYSVADLTLLSTHVVAYGGFRGIDLKAGETVIVAPATGVFSGAAVEVASALGARVLAVGRNIEALQEIAARNARVSIVQLKGNVEEDLASLKKFGPIDAYLDISPHSASDSTHIRTCLMAVKPYGRVSLMGTVAKDIAIPYVVAMLNNLTIRGQYMYERDDVRGIIKLAEAGVLKLGKEAGHRIEGRFPLEEWEKAFEVAAQNPRVGKSVIFTL
ncbi:hypothetical protein M430DRAFT_98267 [Amorphotheca resinae ATCC 22711]|uniref:Alcohol dehydrogenase-like C-terminal domain-containing protein n=1 Tax=Amorphotheca resinae ATCC 22711 TaxID=857342 RepID=A0A2T3B788_AMORE|nr:hypothetical protein M430DRAFT_98267 [Amorphotheca resinae ATCC 22711]PSS22746.1 hypothetical protein M430DRAFT_98267 [Amorphotheca resinae ATCC 22711]